MLGQPYRVLRVALIYFVLAAVALRLTRYDGGVAFLWVASSYLIAELSVVARKRWPALLAASAGAGMLATGLYGFGWWAAVPMAFANVLEAGLASYYMRRHAPQTALTTLSWLGRFALFAAIIPPAIASCVAGTVAYSLGKPPMSAAVHFFLGHALSNLTFAPICILLLQGEIANSFRRFQKRKVEAASLLGLSFATTVLCFSQSALPLLFLPVLPVILVTFRLGRGGAVLSMLFLALFGGAMTIAGVGPVQLIAASQGLKVQFFQFYLAMTVLTAWPVAADLSHRSRLHRRLRVSEAQYRLLADHSSDILMQVGADGLIRYVSPSIRQLGGYSPDALVGTNAGELIAPQYREIIRAMHLATMRDPGTTHCFDYEAMTADGTHRWFETHSRAILDEKGEVDGALSIIRDVSARKANEEALSRAAMTDILTGLPNRRAFQQRIDERLRDRRQAERQDCIAVLDIDHFKQVNDRYGHDAGDAVLQSFASIARCAVREQEMVVRLGGEEFAILFADTTIEQAAIICERLRREVAEAVTIVDDLVIRVTVSGGVAKVGPDGLEHALKVADAALYRAKHNGRDQMALAA